MLEFIVANLPMVICFLVGIGLMVLECFLPGFGLPGISGVVLEVISVAMAWNNHGRRDGLPSYGQYIAKHEKCQERQ